MVDLVLGIGAALGPVVGQAERAVDVADDGHLQGVVLQHGP